MLPRAAALSALRILPLLLLLLLVVIVRPALAASPLPAAEGAPAPLRIQLPLFPFAPAWEREVTRLTDELNTLAGSRSPRPAPLRVLRASGEGSPLQDWVAQAMAGTPPDLGVLESTDLAALPESLRRRVRIPTDPALRPLLSSQERRCVPLGAGVPVWLRRHDAPALPGGAHESWAATLGLRSAPPGPEGAGGPAPPRAELAVSFAGSRGLWLFEAWTQRPLWEREAGGLRANRALQAELLELRGLLEPGPGEVRSARSPRVIILASALSAAEAFADGRARSLLTTSDFLPWIEAHGSGGWDAHLLPSRAPGRRAPATHWCALALRDETTLWDWIRLLALGKWPRADVTAGAHRPAGRPAATTPALDGSWRRLAGLVAPPTGRATPTGGGRGTSALERAIATLEREGARTLPPRTTDRDVLRARTAWSRALGTLFRPGAIPSQWPAWSDFWTGLDRDLNR